MDLDKNLARLVVFGLIAGFVGGLGGAFLGNELGLLPAAKPKMVTFNVAKLVNAERAVGSGLIGGKDTNATIVLAHVEKDVRKVIRQEAGPGTIVLVKQGVVSRNLPDITLPVLKELGLPTKVPGLSPMAVVKQVAPTNLDFGNLPPIENQRIQQSEAKAAQYRKQFANEQNSAVMP